MSFGQRLIFGTLFLIGGWLFIGFMMELNGSATRFNPAWRLIGPLYYFLLFAIKWGVYLALAGVALGLVIIGVPKLVRWQSLRWTEANERRLKEEERALRVADQMREREVFKALERKYEMHPELRPPDPSIRAAPSIPKQVVVELARPPARTSEDVMNDTLKDLFGRS